MYPEIFRRMITIFESQALSSDRIKKIYDLAVSFYKEEGNVLNDDSFDIILSVPKSKKRAYRSLWKSVRTHGIELDEAGIAAARKKLTRLYHARNIECGMEIVLKNLTKAAHGSDEHFDVATKELRYTSELIQESGKPVIITNPALKVDDWLKYHDRVRNNPRELSGVPTGIDLLDKRIKGLRNSEVGLITAGTGKGKSVCLLNIAEYCRSTTGDVVYVTIEMPEDQLRQRWYCLVSGIHYEKFRDFQLTRKDKKRLKRKVERAQESGYKLHFIDLPESTTVQRVKVEIENIVREHDIRLICVDYLNIMHSSSGGLGLDWQKQLEIIIDVKQQLARYFHLPVWIPNQATGASADKEHLGISDMAFAKNIPDNVDVGIALTHTDDYEDTGIMNIRFTKTRDFKGTPFRVQTDFDKMKMCVPIESDYEPKKRKKKKRNRKRGKIQT